MLKKQNESSSPPEQQTFVPSFTACENQVLNNLSSSSLSDFISFFFLNSRFSFSLTILCCCEKNEDDQHSQFESFLGENMLALLKEQRTEIQNASYIRSEYPFPLTRIRKIMKSNEKVERISGDAVILIGKACEFLVMELTFQAWFYQEETRFPTLQHWDIGRAINNNNRMAFLSHLIHAHSQKPRELKLFPETDLCDGNSTPPLNMNTAASSGNQLIPQLFPPSTSSMPLKYHPGSKPGELKLFPETDDLCDDNPMPLLNMNPAVSSGNQLIPQLFPLSTSSMPLKYHPGSKPEELKLFPETDLSDGNPMPELNLNAAISSGNQHVPLLFPPSTSSMPLKYHPGSK
ncbi:hypothetical protein M9H77_05553 [Catharanthus roseus]|uniref:Uncharacterized protein n=1 Tax=Catharanthus roseus TaxID=4058 RepID=A0ACC0CHC7_CATRO|nr:hypothetical protein M9H77_05553 [Catharanthus roseus]